MECIILLATSVANRPDLEIPSNVMLKKTRPSFWLAAQVLTWGIVMTCMGSVQGFASLTACRVLLGMCEVSSPSFSTIHAFDFFIRRDSFLALSTWSPSGTHQMWSSSVLLFYILLRPFLVHSVASWLMGSPKWMGFAGLPAGDGYSSWRVLSRRHLACFCRFSYQIVMKRSDGSQRKRSDISICASERAAIGPLTERETSSPGHCCSTRC